MKPRLRVARNHPLWLAGSLAVSLGLALAVGFATVGDAATTIITVNTTSDVAGGCPATCSLRAAVTQAIADGTANPVQINIPAGTYALTLGDLDLSEANGTFILNGTTGNPADVVIDQTSKTGGSTTVNNIAFLLGFDVSTFSNVSNQSTTLQNLTIEGGVDTRNDGGGDGGGFGGGAIQQDGVGPNLTITNCVFENNKSLADGSGGGAIFQGDGSLTVTNSTFSNNTSAAGFGGAIGYSDTGLAAGDVLISGSTFDNNAVTAAPGAADSGGGVSIGGSSINEHATVENSTFMGNSSGASGGGLFISAATSTTVTQSQFIDNIAGTVTQGQGGGLYVESSNTTASAGAGSVTLDTFTGNSASGNSGGGGAVWNESGTTTVSHDRIVGNTASFGSGVVMGAVSGTAIATDDWWGVNAGPGAGVLGDANGGALPTDPAWLQLRDTPAQATDLPGGTDAVTADILGLNTGGALASGSLDGLATFPATAGVWGSPTDGTISPSSTQFVNGVAGTTTFTAGDTLGNNAGVVPATADNQTGDADINIKANSSTSVSTNPSTSVFGQPVTLSATLTSASGTTVPAVPQGGTVQFQVDGTNTGSPAAVSNGTATLNDSSMSVGSHSVTAVYSGDSDFNGSTSATGASQTVNKADTATSVGSSVNPSLFSQSVTFAATVTAVAPGAGTPGGTVQFEDNGSPIGSPLTLNGSGVASFSASSLAVGSHPITAVYAGNTDFNPSTGTLSPSQVVNPDPTSLSLASPTNPSVFGQGVTFTATVSSGFGTPTGAVQFGVDGANVGGAVSLSSGSASVPGITDLAVGTHTVTATYSGTTDFSGSSGTLGGGQTVNKANTATTIGSSANPATAGTPLSFTATVTAVSPGMGTPTGQVDFVIDGGAPMPATLNASGVATLPGVSLPVGSHSVVASYQGDPDFAASSSATLTQVVNGFATTTTLSSAHNPSVFGQPVSFTATVAAGANGTPTGSVQFGVDGANAGSPVTLVGGAASSAAISSLAVGTHTVTATYTATGDFAGSTGALAGGQIVIQAATAMSLGSSANPSAFGQPVSFTATVSPMAPGAGTPTGQVSFFVDGTSFGSAVTLSGGAASSGADSSLAVGTHTVTATYGGDSDFTSATSPTLDQVVGRVNAGFGLTSSQNPSVSGQPVQFTATLSGPAGTPTGSVQFGVNGANLGAPVTLVGGVASSAADSSLPVGTSTVTASYSGDANYNPGSATLASGQTVNKANTTTTIRSSANPSTAGTPLSFTATVTAVSLGAGTPTGQVDFVIDGGAPMPASLNGSGVATLPGVSLPVGSHSVVASYQGDPDFNASSSATLTQVVNGLPTTINLVSSASPSVFGQPVSFTATVSAGANGTPTGSVQFGVDGANAGSPVTLSGGVASSAAISSLAVGTHTVTATYTATGDFAASTGTLPGGQVVIQASTTTQVTSSPNPSVFGQPVVVTATVGAVAPGAGTPTGAVQFQVDSVDIGSPVGLSGGVAMMALPGLLVGTHTLQGTYGGDTNFTPSSGTSGQAVNLAASAVAAGSSVNPSVIGEGITFAATVTAVAPGAGTPTGTVSFFVDGTHYEDDALASGVAHTTVPDSSLAIGDHAVTATYSGNADFTASSGGLTQTVAKASSTTTVVSALPTTVFGQPVTFTATVAVVAPGTGTPTGTVEFFADGTSFGSSPLTGSSAVSPVIGSLAAGIHTVTATYRGDDTFRGSTGATAQTVGPASTTVVLTGTPDPSVFGQLVTFSATVTAVAPGAGIPTGTVHFAGSGFPIPGVDATLVNGVATATNTAVPVGTTTLSANYEGNGDFSPGATTAGQQVTAASTTTTLASSANPSLPLHGVTFTATVAPVAPGAGTPAGQVLFQFNGGPLGLVTLVNGVAVSPSTPNLLPGSFDVTATYQGSTDFTSSQGTLTQVAGKLAPVIGVTSTVNPSVFGQPVGFAATVSGSDGTPTGSIQFGTDGVNLGSPVTLVNGVATSTAIASLAPGDHPVTATYTGDTVYTAGAGSVTQTVGAAGTTTGVNSSVNPSVFGQPVHFTATVSAVAPGAGTPTGQVQFLIDGSIFGSPVTLSGGSASSGDVSSLAVGNHRVEADYLGNADFAASSGVLSGGQTVNASNSGVSVSSSANPSSFGEAVHFTAAVSASGGGAGTPTGQVQFLIDGSNFGSPVTLSGGSASSGDISSLMVGNHQVEADYLGSPSFNAMSGTLGGGQSVNRASTATSVISSANPSIAGTTVTFTATVTPVAPAAGTPGGTVQFVIDGSPAGAGVNLANGSASYVTSSLVAGPHSVTAVYSGSASFAPSTGTLSGGQTVATPAMADLQLHLFGPRHAVDALPVVFTIEVTNAGPNSATGVTVVDTLPASYHPVRAVSSEGSCSTSGTKVSCLLGDLGVHPPAFVAVVAVPTQRGRFTNAASVSADQVDPSPANDSASISTRVHGFSYWLLGADGGIFTFGDGGFYGSTGGMRLNQPVVAMVPTPDGLGYWLVASDGGIFSFGDAGFFGSEALSQLPAPITGMAATPDGAGYWLVGADGSVYPFGDAGAFGSGAGTAITGRIVAIVASPDGGGYWLASSAGAVYPFGDASSFGSLSGAHLGAQIVGMAAAPDGQGYWLAGADGGVFAFGDAGFFGSLGGKHLNGAVVTIAATQDGQGYWLVAADGGVFAFGDAGFEGSMGGQHLNKPVIGLSP